MDQNRFTVQKEVLQPSGVITATANGANARYTATSRVVEVWINVTAVGGSGDFDYVIKTSIDGANFFNEDVSVAAISTTGMRKVVLNRADNALGTHIRVDFVKNSGTNHTVEIIMIRME